MTQPQDTVTALEAVQRDIAARHQFAGEDLERIRIFWHRQIDVIVANLAGGATAFVDLDAAGQDAVARGTDG